MVWTEDFRAGVIKKQDSTDAGVPLVVHGITNIRYSLASSVRTDRGGGSVYPDSANLDSVSPVISFTTHDIGRARATFGMSGKCITGDVDDPGIVVYAQKYSCAGASTSANNRTYTIKYGLVVPRTLTIDHQGNASISYDIFAAWDGTTDPVVVAADATLPTRTAQTYPVETVYRWSMYDMTINGTSLTGKRQITIDFGCTVTHEAADGSKYPTTTTLSSMMPRVTVRGVDPSWLEDFGVSGTRVVSATSVIDLLKRNEAATAAKHITFSITGMATWDTPIDAGIDGPGEATLNIDCVYDSTNAPIVVAYDQALE